MNGITRFTPNLRRLGAGALALACWTLSGCITWTDHAVPAYRLPLCERLESESAKIPIDLALLRQEPPPAHIVGPRDLLSVYVYGILPPKLDESPVVQPGFAPRDNYYPAYGALRVPSLGLPLEVNADGTLTLPRVGKIPVQGLTLDQTRDRILEAYEQVELAKAGSQQALVTLLRPRVYRVLVIREDAGSEVPSNLFDAEAPYTKRGRAQVLDLPAFENDVLHALAASGGLPGLDARNEVWVLRGQGASPQLLVWDELQAAANTVGMPAVFEKVKAHERSLCIPLRVFPGQPPMFGPDDVILRDGDVVFVPQRHEFYYTGGLLEGRQIPLPRDRDIDVVDAIALAGGSVGGQSAMAQRSNPFQTGAGPGNVIIPPTRVLVLRTLPDGRRMAIRVNLARAMHDPKERIVIRPEDVVLLQYKPGEVAANSILKFFNWNLSGTLTYVPTN